MLPQHYIPEGAPNGTPVPLGPLFSGQNVTCEDGQRQPLHCTHTDVEGTPTCCCHAFTHHEMPVKL